MKSISRTHTRSSLPLKNYHYEKQGACFVTIFTKNRECLFGEIRDGGIKLNDAGVMVRQVWDALHESYHGVATDQCTIMPDHVYGIILLKVGTGTSACPDPHAKGKPQRAAPAISLPDVIHQFKSDTTARYLFGEALLNWPPCDGKLWQHNYYERVIANEDELMKFREYFRNDPLQWHPGKNNPMNARP